MKNALLLALCSVGVLATGCTKSDSPNLQGTWNGQEIKGRTQGSSSLVLERANFEFHGPDTNEWYKATFSLREDLTPKQLEVVITDCPFPPYVGKTSHIIYKIEGGKLTLAAFAPGKSPAPASFDEQGAREFVFLKK